MEFSSIKPDFYFCSCVTSSRNSAIFLSNSSMASMWQRISGAASTVFVCFSCLIGACAGCFTNANSSCRECLSSRSVLTWEVRESISELRSSMHCWLWDSDQSRALLTVSSCSLRWSSGFWPKEARNSCMIYLSSAFVWSRESSMSVVMSKLGFSVSFFMVSDRTE